MTTSLYRFFKTLGCALLASACISSVSATDAQNPWMKGVVDGLNLPIDWMESGHLPADYVGAFHFCAGNGYKWFMGERERTWGRGLSYILHYLSPQGGPSCYSDPQNVSNDDFCTSSWGRSCRSLWIEKRGGGLFDVNRIKLTKLNEGEGPYFIVGYRDGVKVADFSIGEQPEVITSIAPSELTFDVDMSNIDYFRISALGASDGFHSKVDSVEGVDHPLSGPDRPWAYSEADILVGPERIGTRSIMQDKLHYYADSEPYFSGAFIESIRASFSIRAFTAGLHTATFMVTDKDGRKVGDFRWEEVLASPGPAVVSVDLDAEMLRMGQHDGPFNIESVVLTAPDGTASAALLPSREQIPFSRWNYHPGNKIGDMNGDGVIDLADRDILAGFRNTRLELHAPDYCALLFDRRDLSRVMKRSGYGCKIDLQDVLLLQDIIRRQ